MIHRIEIHSWRPYRDNQIAGGIHWAVRNERKNSDKTMVAWHVKAQDVPPALGKRRVSLEITLTGRQKEADPLAYAKSLLDSLVACRMLVDDNSQFVEWVPPVYTKGEELKTVIVLEDLE